MRLATFNVENMFERARALNLDTWAEGRPVLEDFERLNTLIQEAVYTPAIKAELLAIMGRHKGLLTQSESRFIRLRDIRRKLIARPRGKPAEIAVNGRGDWIGWFELQREPVKEAATENTARVIGLLQSDVLCVVEAEDRIGLKRFNDDVIPSVGTQRFEHVMLIDGNDERGIDVGILTRAGFDIVRMLSHVDARDATGIVFSRDCAEYEITTPKGGRLLVLINHFKSKGYGSTASSNAKRLRQARRTREIYDRRIKDGYEHIAIAGDLNEVPDGAPLAPLLGKSPKLIDVMTHKTFVGDGRPGTYANGTKSGKFDYILLSPRLAKKVTAAGIERRGVWGGKNGTLFPHLPTMKSDKDAASDHAALWVDLDI